MTALFPLVIATARNSSAICPVRAKFMNALRYSTLSSCLSKVIVPLCSTTAFFGSSCCMTMYGVFSAPTFAAIAALCSASSAAFLRSSSAAAFSSSISLFRAFSFSMSTPAASDSFRISFLRFSISFSVFMCSPH